MRVRNRRAHRVTRQQLLLATHRRRRARRALTLPMLTAMKVRTHRCVRCNLNLVVLCLTGGAVDGEDGAVESMFDKM
jgi:hypothetical protein